MSESQPGPTHRRVLLGHLVSIVAIVALGLGVVAIVTAFSTREFAAFLFGAGVFVGCIGLSHSHSLRCTRIRLDPASKPGRELHVLPWIVVAGFAALLIFAADAIPDTPLAVGSIVAAAVGIGWAVLFGGRAVRRIPTTQT